ncbi:MAG: radical SAM protein [Phycisphaerales bacterium]|nr:radical SAM protein [Phycisphaerales bacterium]
MYNKLDYVRRGLRLLNNTLRPGEKKLSVLMLYATDLCDSGCKHCLIWAKRPAKHLAMDKIIEIMGSKCINKNTLIGLEGGEFLLHPDAFKILAWFKKNHPKFDLLSNCLQPDNVIEAVKQYPPQRLYISLDGTKETYLHMRGKDGYDKVLKVIEHCKDIVPMSLMFTLSPYNNFKDMEHVVDVATKNKIDVRVGIYNDIAFFNTVEKAHETEIGEIKNDEILSFSVVKNTKNDLQLRKNEALRTLQSSSLEQPKHDQNKLTHADDFKSHIPKNIVNTKENLDFILLYDEWRKKKLKMKCRSITDGIVIHTNGDVPICQNLDQKLGNIHTSTLDEIFNSLNTQKIHKEYQHCNQCWLNFHRKYDIVMMRTAEKIAPKWLVEKVFGEYQWTDDSRVTYKQFMKEQGWD